MGPTEVRIGKEEAEIVVDTPPRGFLSGLGQGLVEGVIIAPGVVLAPFCPPLASAALMPVVDPIIGAAKASSAEEVDKIEASLRAALRRTAVCEHLTDQLRGALRDPRRGAPLDDARPPKTIIEIGVESFGLSHLLLGVLHDERAFIVAKVRIIRADNHVLLYEGRTEWQSGEHPFNQWPAKLSAHVNQGCDVLAGRIANALYPLGRERGGVQARR
jgi:hypothetical protein